MYWFTPGKKAGKWILKLNLVLIFHPINANTWKSWQEMRNDLKSWLKLGRLGERQSSKKLAVSDVIYLLKIYWKFPYLNYDPGWFLGKLVWFYGTVRLSADTRLTPGLGFQRLPIPTSTVQLYSSVTGRDKVHVPHFAWIKTCQKNKLFFNL